MIRNPAAGDRITAPGWPHRRPGAVVEVRRPSSGKGPVRVVVALDDAPDVPRIFGALELDPEALPATRNRRRSAR